MPALLRKWFRHRPSPARPWFRRRPEVEALEDRMLLSHTPLTPFEFQVNAGVPGQYASFPVAPVAVASDADGDFVVAWAAVDTGAEGLNVLARTFDRNGNPTSPDIVVASNVIAPQSGTGAITVDVAMDADGDFVVVYDAALGQGGQVFARLFAAGGSPVKPEPVLVTPNSFEFLFTGRPSVAMDDVGNFVVAFFDDYGGDIFVRRFDSAGTALGPPVQVDTPGTNPVSSAQPKVASDGAGNFVVTWNAFAGEGLQIVARRFAVSGAASDVIVVSQDARFSSRPDVGVGRTGGTFVIAWDTFDSATEGGVVIKARRFAAAAGNPLGNEFVVNDQPLDVTFPPSVAVDAQEDFVVAWATGLGSASSVFFRAFDVDGTLVEPGQQQVNVNSSDFGPNDVASDDCGNIVVGWSGQLPQQGQDIFARIFRVPQSECPPELRAIPPPDVPPDLLAVPLPPPPPPVVPPVVPPAVPAFDSGMIIATVNAIIVPPGAEDAAFFLPVGDELLFPPPAPPLASRGLSLEAFLDLGTGRRDAIGEIGGTVFEDKNGNGRQDRNEPSLVGQLVFIDHNDNGVPDPDEPQMETDENGQYLFGGLGLTRHKVRQDLRPLRVRQTTPQGNSAHVVDLTKDQSSVANKDFGARVIPVTGGGGKRRPDNTRPEAPSPRVKDKPPPEPRQDSEPQGSPEPQGAPEPPPPPERPPS
jgi:hypothetical protein